MIIMNSVTYSGPKKIIVTLSTAAQREKSCSEQEEVHKKYSGANRECCYARAALSESYLYNFF